MRKIIRISVPVFLIAGASTILWHMMMIWKYEYITIYESNKYVLGLEILGMAIAISFGIIEVYLVLKRNEK